MKDALSPIYAIVDCVHPFCLSQFMKTYLHHHTGKMENACGCVLVHVESLEVSGAKDVKNGCWSDDY